MLDADRGRGSEQVAGWRVGRVSVALAATRTGVSSPMTSPPASAAAPKRELSADRRGFTVDEDHDAGICLRLREAVMHRDGRNLVLVVPELAGERIVLVDSTGNVELLLELLDAGPRTRTEIVREFTSKREGAEAPAVAAALDGLERLGVIVASRTGRAQAERGPHHVGNEVPAVLRSPPGLPYSGAFGVPASGMRP